MRISGTEHGIIIEESWVMYQEVIIRVGGGGEFNRSSYEEATVVKLSNAFFARIPACANENRPRFPQIANSDS